jgi:hypothetical protein
MIHCTIHRAPDSNKIAEIKISVTQSSLPEFNELIDRALNCWPDAPKELKDLGDMLTHGRITQDHTYHKVGAAYTSCGEYTAAEQLAIKEIKESISEEEYRELLLGDRVELTKLIKQQLR